MEEDKQNPQSLTSSTTTSSNSCVKNSPEFEFWMVRNIPSFPQLDLVSADELIVDGVLLPLDLVSHQNDVVVVDKETEQQHQPQKPKVVVEETEDIKEPDSILSQLSVVDTELTSVSSASKRWRDIFKKGEKKSSVIVEDKEKNFKEKEKKKDRKSVSSSNNGGVSSGTELNINIWPFSRSWSAGNRSKIGGGGGSVTRKVSSAPCSRSNSAGESKSRKWPNSPSRTGGIHLGRNSPVWHVKPRNGSGLRNTEPVMKSGVRKESVVEKVKSKSNGDVGANKSKGLNLNVPMCIGYRQQLSCRRDENILIGDASSNGGDGGGGCSNSSSGSIASGCSNNTAGALGGNKLFYLRTLFTKKVY